MATFIEVVCGSPDVVAALDALGAFRPRLVLMDIEMPSMDGMKALLIDASRLLPLELSGCLQTRIATKFELTLRLVAEVSFINRDSRKSFVGHLRSGGACCTAELKAQQFLT